MSGCVWALSTQQGSISLPQDRNDGTSIPNLSFESCDDLSPWPRCCRAPEGRASLCLLPLLCPYSQERSFRLSFGRTWSFPGVWARGGCGPFPLLEVEETGALGMGWVMKSRQTQGERMLGVGTSAAAPCVPGLQGEPSSEPPWASSFGANASPWPAWHLNPHH